MNFRVGYVILCGWICCLLVVSCLMVLVVAVNSVVLYISLFVELRFWCASFVAFDVGCLFCLY